MKRLCTVIVLLFLFTALQESKQANGQKSERLSVNSEGKNKRRRDRLQILQQELPKLTGSALTFKNPELKIETLARVADALWSVDNAGGRQLFQKTYDLLRAIEPANDGATTRADDTTPKMPRSKLVGLYVRFLSRLAKHDPAWKEQLLKDAPDFLSSSTLARNLDLHTAHLLLKEKDPEAFSFIKTGLSNGISGLTDTMQLLDLLSRFRQLDALKADQLFLNVLRQLEAQSNVAADDLLTIGNYLFTGRPADSGQEDMILITPVYVGRIGFHADISYDRPGHSRETVEGYLRASVAILTQPADNQALLQNRAAAFLLLPKARRFVPDLVPVLSNLSIGIDPAKTNSVEARSGATEPTKPSSVEAIIETLNGIKDPVKKDEYCLRMIWSFYLASDFKSAGELVDHMSSLEIRTQLSSLVRIGQAINFLQKGDLDSARVQIRSLPSGRERSFLWFTLASRMIDKGDNQNGQFAIQNGLEDARRTEGSNKAFLLLLGAELSYGIDFAAGSNILTDAVAVINSLDSDLNDPLRFDRFVRVKVGSQSATFSTDVRGSRYGTVQGALKVPVARDPDEAITLILQLKNEYARSSALLAFVSVLTS